MFFSNGSYWYSFFYLVAFLVAILIEIREGYSRKIPLTQWVISILFINLLFIVGTKVATYSVEDWYAIAQSRELIEVHGKSILGGFAFGMMAILIIKKWFRYDWGVFDNFALALPIAMSLQRLGCFSYGCCYGTPTQASWGIQYGVNSLPHIHHFQQGFISNSDTLSLNIHPVQLYQSIILFFIFIVLLIIKHRIKAPGKLFLISFGLITICRIAVEFLRDPLAHTIGINKIGFFNGAQWAMLLLLIAFLLLLVLSKINRTYFILNFSPTISLTFKEIILFLIATITYLFTKEWLSSTERIVILGLLFPSGIVLGWKLITGTQPYQVKWYGSTFLILPLTLMATQSQDTIRQDSISSYHLIGVGFLMGEKNNEINYNTGNTVEGCGGPVPEVDYEYFNHKYYLESLDYQKVKVNSAKRIRKYQQFSLFGGEHVVNRLSDNNIERSLLWGASANFVREGHLIGVGGGIIAGNLIGVPSSKKTSARPTPNEALYRIPIFPRFYFRWGREDILFGEINIANDFPNSLLNSPYRLGIGSGFGTKDKYKLRMGLTHYSGLDRGLLTDYYVNIQFPIRDRLKINSTYLNQSSIFEDKGKSQFSLNVLYKIGD